MSDARPDDSVPAPLAGGRLLSEITNRIVAFMREHYGRGPIKAKTYVLDNLIVCVLSNGFTAIERTMMRGGEPDRVLEMRRDFQRLMKERYTEMVEQLTGRKVLAFLSQAHVEPDLTIEVFLMDGPLAGFGALELVDRRIRLAAATAGQWIESQPGSRSGKLDVVEADWRSVWAAGTSRLKEALALVAVRRTACGGVAPVQRSPSASERGMSDPSVRRTERQRARRLRAAPSRAKHARDRHLRRAVPGALGPDVPDARASRCC